MPTFTTFFLLLLLLYLICGGIYYCKKLSARAKQIEPEEENMNERHVIHYSSCMTLSQNNSRKVQPPAVNVQQSKQTNTSTQSKDKKKKFQENVEDTDIEIEIE